METLKYNSGNQIYFDHVIKQLFNRMFYDMKIDFTLKKTFIPNQLFKMNDIINADNIYIQAISEILNQNINYYLKKLDINVSEATHKIIELKYNYYKTDNNILNTDINVYYI